MNALRTVLSSTVLRLVALALVTTAASATVGCGADDGVATARPKSKSKKPTTDGGASTDGEDDDNSGGGSGSGGSPTGNPDGGTQTQAETTNGTGGPTGFNTLTSAGGLSYQINAPAGATARGLLVLLHGSSKSNYETFVTMMEPVATKYDLIRVSVLAPNQKGWNEGNQVNAALLLNRLIQEDLFPKYNIDKTKVLFSGQSSGGGFLSSHFVPLYGKGYKGGAFLQCGMAPPQSQFTPDAAMKSTFKLHFEITSGDPIWPQSYQQALAAYSAAGYVKDVDFTTDNTKPGGHCSFSQPQVIIDHIGFILGKN